MVHMTYIEKNAAIARAIAEFPAEFGLRAFPGKKFRVSHSSSYWSDGDVLLYTDVFDGGTWHAFAKGTPKELRAQITSG